MSTVTQVVDRIYRDWLHAADDQPIVITLDGAINSSVTAVVYDNATLAPDEEDLLAPGVIIEINTEQMRVTDVAVDTSTLTVTRAVNGTTADSHSDNDDITVAPTFPRSVVTEAVYDNVVALYPSLWRYATETISTSDTFIEVPDALITPSSFIYLDGARYRNGNVDLLPYPFPAATTTGKAVQVYGVPAGKTGYLTYRAKFDRPTDPTDDLGTLGVDPEWERIVAVGAAAQVVSSRDLDALSVEFITEQLEREVQPPGSQQDIRNGLLTLHRIWMQEAARSLGAQQQVPVTYNLPFRG